MQSPGPMMRQFIPSTTDHLHPGETSYQKNSLVQGTKYDIIGPGDCTMPGIDIANWMISLDQEVCFFFFCRQEGQTVNTIDPEFPKARRALPTKDKRYTPAPVAG